MAANLRTEMIIPTRSAPRPPIQQQPRLNGSNQRILGSSNSDASMAAVNDPWSTGNEIFGTTLQVPQKKKPPPRPPPPKFPANSVYNQEKPKKPARPTELLTNLFGRRGSKHSVTSAPSSSTTYSSTTSRMASSHHYNTFQQPPPTITKTQEACLIDLSPPGSPTFTTRSSSDGVSVDSFGSDGNSNPSAFTSSGSTSQTESAFEDDFDFFGNLSASKLTGAMQQVQSSSDPWKVSCSQDPFGSLESGSCASSITSSGTTKTSSPWTVMNHNPCKEVGESNFFANFDTRGFDSPPPTEQVPKKKPFVMPTIIRVRSKDPPPKPKPPIFKSSSSTNNYSSAPRLTPTHEAKLRLAESPTKRVADKSDDDKLTSVWGDEEDDDNNFSPPMPTLPPPPPPPEYIAGLEDGLVQNSERPYGVALYDFPASQAGDLELKEGNVVYLTKLINDNWMEGRVGSSEGMFPINFIDIKIPLPGIDANVANALYTFKAETADDLSFEEGARIKVLSKVNEDWLYGECNGKRGQFPANFIDKVPNDLPNHL